MNRWIWQIIKKGIYGNLEFSDFTPKSEYAGVRASKLKEPLKLNWGRCSYPERNNFQYGLLYAIFLTFKITILVTLAIRVLDRCFLMAFERLLLGQVVQEIRSCSTIRSECTSWVFFTFITITTTRSILHRIFYYMIKGLCKKIRIALNSLIYGKMLRLSQGSLRQIMTGDMVHLISNGGMIIENASVVASVLTGPLQIIAQFYVLWTQFGIASGAGLTILMVLGIWQSYLDQLATKYRAKIVSTSANRIRLVNQIISGIKTIKIQALETIFLKLLYMSRRKECEQLQRSNMLEAVRYITAFCSPLFAIVLMVSCYVTLGYDKSAEQIIVASTIFYHLRALLFIDIPTGVKQLGSVINIISKFQKVLEMEEVIPLSTLEFAKGEIKIQNLDLGLGLPGFSLVTVIKDGNLQIEHGELLQIVGKTGTGKTALLKAICGEFPIESGKIQVGGQISYAAQESWIFPGTIRENILFHSPYQPTRYNKVLSICALQDDLSCMAGRDQTLLSDGSELSGGQRARISLARAVYRDADIYLLDDVLSNVDSVVGSHIFNHCINGFLKNKTIILVSGNHNIPMSHFPNASENVKYLEQMKPANESKINRAVEMDLQTSYPKFLKSARYDVKVYFEYLTIGRGFKYLIQYFITTALMMTVYHGTEFMLHQSFQKTTVRGSLNLTHFGFSYAIMGLIFIASLQLFLLLRIISNGSENFHEKMVSSILRAPIKFFSSTSPGEILTRFTSDLSIIDEVLAFRLHDACHIFLMYLSGYILVVYKFGLLTTIPLIILFTFGFYVQKYNNRVCQQLTNLLHAAKDPLISWISTSMTGISTIRALGKYKEMKTQYDLCLDRYFWINYAHLTIDDLATLMIDLATVGLLNTLVISALIFPVPGIESILSPLLSFGATIGFAFSLGVVLTTNATSAEAILNLHEILPEIQASIEDEQRDLQNWPWKGKIKFCNVSAKYDVEKPIVKNLNFTIQPGENVAIIGQTGCGKSTLISALVRMVDYSGEILVDGVNITQISLKRLRQNMFILPQDPYLFPGKLRFSLDPFEDYEDNELLKALEIVLLKNVFETLPDGLQTEISENQNLFSCGQWQLIGLARAVLRKPKILVLDESTAHIDATTTHAVLTEIRKVLPESTIITVLHRLTYLHTYDKVMVINGGEIMQFKTPESLGYTSAHFKNGVDNK